MDQLNDSSMQDSSEAEYSHQDSGGIHDVAEIAGSHSRGHAAGGTDFRRTGSCAGSLAARAAGGTVQAGEDGIGYKRIFGSRRGNAIGHPEGWNHGRAVYR